MGIMNTNTIAEVRTPHAGAGTPSHRALAMLRAVGSGRGQLSCSREPDLFIDGVSCGDQFTAHVLAHRGLVAPGRPGLVGQRVPAVLTASGQALIGTAPMAA
jgi:hypothetical protein